MNAVDQIEETKKGALAGLRRGTIVQYILSALLLIFLGWSLVDAYRNRDAPRIDEIHMTEAKLLTPAHLCPGKSIVSQYTVHIEGEGPIIRDSSVQRIEPAQIISFSDPQRYPLTGPLTETVTIAWKIPESYIDYQQGVVVEFPPGAYLHNLSVTSAGGRFPAFDMVSLPFTVTNRADCNG